MDLELRTELAVRGLRSAPAAAAPGRAGPSDDGHWPARRRARRRCRWRPTRRSRCDDGGPLTRDGVVVEDAMLEPIERPRFYDLQTADGDPLRAARAAARHRACWRRPSCRPASATRARTRAVASARSRSRCAPARRRRSSAPSSSPRSPQAAVRLDGVRQMVMTTGHVERARPRRAAPRALRRAPSARRVPGLPIQVQIEPPLRPRRGSTRLQGRRRRPRSASTSSRSTTAVRARWTPGKATRAARALRARPGRRPSRVFGANRVSTYLLVGLGEDPDELVAGARAAHRDGRLSVRRPLPPARRLARARRRRAGARPATLVARHAPRRRARCARRACAAPTRSPAARPAAPARRCRRSADERGVRPPSPRLERLVAAARRAGRRRPAT